MRREQLANGGGPGDRQPPDGHADVDPAAHATPPRADEAKPRTKPLSAREEAIDDAVEMTFPASDPPAWMSSGVPPARAQR